jgi:hypothetical protein
VGRAEWLSARIVDDIRIGVDAIAGAKHLPYYCLLNGEAELLYNVWYPEDRGKKAHGMSSQVLNLSKKKSSLSALPQLEI